MSKAVGWAVGGAIVSVTVGVLVGLVVHTGQLERANQGARSAPVSSDSSAAPPSTARIRAVPLPSAPTSSKTPNPPGISSHSPSHVPAGLPPPPDTTAVTGDATTVEAEPTASSTTATATQTGAPDTAGAPCDALAARSEDARGTTLYCQVDQSDHTLRWRAVIDQGGCLNRSMTGTGADGHQYECRLDSSGLNHWAAVG